MDIQAPTPPRVAVLGAAVEAVIAAVGLRPIRAGDAGGAGLLDGITRLWFQLAFTAGRGHRLAVTVLEG